MLRTINQSKRQENMVNMNQSKNSKNSIPEFYNGKSVFITGASGFLGKVLVEKLLRSCPGIENVFLLVRSKKGKNVEERLAELTSSQAFDILREQDPQAIRKIILIEGDTSKIGLGISKENRELLCEKVSVIFHSAATIRFIDTLKVAVNTNLRALNELITLAREIKDLKAFVHISTAYSNWFQPLMREEYYPAAFDPHYIMDLCSSMPDALLKEVTPTLLGKHTNVYTFTKGLAEDLVVKTAKDLPFAIVRPSGVGSSLAEPHVGWIDSCSAVTPLVDQASKGILRTFHCNKDFVADVLPLDLVINQIIAVSWKTACDKALKPEISTPVFYNCVSGNTNPITIQQLYQYSRDAGRKSPSDLMRWYPQTRFYKSKMLFEIDTFLTGYIPALMRDVINKLREKDGKSVNSYNQVQFGYSQLRFSMVNKINMYNENYQKLKASMTESDQKVFYFDPKCFNWRTYIDDFYHGIGKFMFNDKSIGSVAAQKKLNRLKYMNHVPSGSIVAFSLIATGIAFKKVSNQFINKGDEYQLKLDQQALSLSS